MLISIKDFNVYLLLFTASSLITACFLNTRLWFLGGYKSAIKKEGGGKECKQCIKNNSISEGRTRKQGNPSCYGNLL